jgi:hypothetical protein
MAAAKGDVVRSWDRRAALAMLFGGIAATLGGCAWGDDPDLVALRRDYMATWMPEDVTSERRQEQNPTKDFVGATNYASVLRTLNAPDEAAVRQGQEAAMATALANGWQVGDDKHAPLTKTLSTGSEAELSIGRSSVPQPEWFIALRA